MKREIRDAFDAIRADEALKDSTKQFLRDARRAKQPRPAFRARFAAVLAALVLCMLCAGGVSYVQSPVSYISIDVNPSIELALNRLNRVVSARAWNADAEIVLQDVRVEGLPYAQAIDAILESTAMKPYLTKQAALSFTVAAKNEQTESELLRGIGQCTGCMKYRGFTSSADAALIQEAHEQGFSFGKYRAYQELLAQGHTITPEECREMSMAQIRSLLRGTDAVQASGQNCKRQRSRGQGVDAFASETP